MLDNETLRLINKFMGYDEVIGFVIIPAWERLPARNEMEEKRGRFKDKEGHWEMWAYDELSNPFYKNDDGKKIYFKSRGQWFVGKIEGTKEEIIKLGFPVRPRKDDEIFKVGWPSG